MKEVYTHLNTTAHNKERAQEHTHTLSGDVLCDVRSKVHAMHFTKCEGAFIRETEAGHESATYNIPQRTQVITAPVAESRALRGKWMFLSLAEN